MHVGRSLAMHVDQRREILHRWNIALGRQVSGQIRQVVISPRYIRSRFIRWKRDSFLKSGHIHGDTGSGVRENRFIEDDIARYINASSGAV